MEQKQTSLLRDFLNGSLVIIVDIIVFIEMCLLRA